jgi:hypothetical protein
MTTDARFSVRFPTATLWHLKLEKFVHCGTPSAAMPASAAPINILARSMLLLHDTRQFDFVDWWCGYLCQAMVRQDGVRYKQKLTWERTAHIMKVE